MATVTAPAITTWNIDPVHSNAQFKVKHMMISNVKGEFTGVTGTLKYDRENLASSQVEASIDASTISTSEAQRDAHLKSADFFDVEKFPKLTFKSTRVTKNVVFDVEGPSDPMKDPWGNTRVGLSATTKISRKDFGLTWNAALETGGILVGDEVTITLEVQFIKA